MSVHEIMPHMLNNIRRMAVSPRSLICRSYSYIYDINSIFVFDMDIIRGVVILTYLNRFYGEEDQTKTCGSQAQRVALVWHAPPPSRSGHRSTLHSARFLRSPGHTPGQIRNDPWCANRWATHQPGRQSLRLLPAHVLPGSGRLPKPMVWLAYCRKSGDRRKPTSFPKRSWPLSINCAPAKRRCRHRRSSSVFTSNSTWSSIVAASNALWPGGQKNASSPPLVPSPQAAAADDLVANYELLRTQVVGTQTREISRPGWALLVRQGLACWLATLSSPKPARVPGWTLNPSIMLPGTQSDVTNVLVTMVWSHYLKKTL